MKPVEVEEIDLLMGALPSEEMLSEVIFLALEAMRGDPTLDAAQAFMVGLTFVIPPDEKKEVKPNALSLSSESGNAQGRSSWSELNFIF